MQITQNRKYSLTFIDFISDNRIANTKRKQITYLTTYFPPNKD